MTGTSRTPTTPSEFDRLVDQSGTRLRTYHPSTAWSTQTDEIPVTYVHETSTAPSTNQRPDWGYITRQQPDPPHQLHASTNHRRVWGQRPRNGVVEPDWGHVSTSFTSRDLPLARKLEILSSKNYREQQFFTACQIATLQLREKTGIFLELLDGATIHRPNGAPRCKTDGGVALNAPFRADFFQCFSPKMLRLRQFLEWFDENRFV